MRAMTDFTHSLVSTDRLETNVWTSGPADGVPLLLVHGNLVTGGWWKYVAEVLPVESPHRVAAAIDARMVR